MGRIGRKRKNADLDYSEQVLKRMSYRDLRNESFDHDPAVGNSPIRSNRKVQHLLILRRKGRDSPTNMPSNPLNGVRSDMKLATK